MSNEVQTCVGWKGPGLEPYEIPEGGTRHRWHCFECGGHGPVEVDGAVCRSQLKRHVCHVPDLTSHERQ